jgi:hypothetical protein
VSYQCGISESPDGGKDIVHEFATSTDPGVMYLHQAMSAPDKEEFREAMIKEVNFHSDNVDWLVMDRCDVPNGHKVLPAIWSTPSDVCSRQGGVP